MASGGIVGSSSLHDDETLIRFDHVPSYVEFHERCLVPNRPCIFPPGLIAHWHIVQTQAWALSSSGSADSSERLVNWNTLKRDYAAHTSPVVITRESEESRSEMSISDAVELIHAFQQNRTDPSVRSVYIKDWHLIKQLQNHQAEPYSVPDVFRDDWMNNIAEEGGDDFRFVYAGTTGSQTLLHRDVYTSYSWSSNVVGKKRWWLFPPRVITHLRRFPKVNTSELIPDVNTLLSTIATCQADARKEYSELESAWDSVQVVDQQQGETIFIPSNWYHQVQNLTEAISINRNWCNSVNIPSLYQSIVAELTHVEQSLSDVKHMLKSSSDTRGNAGNDWKKEFFELVQDVAVKDAGWAWAGFWNMILHNLEKPATELREDLRPKDEWVKQRLLPLVKDFETRDDGQWLDAAIAETASKCKALLEAMGD